MNITKKDLAKSQIELTVELSAKEFEPYIKRGVEKVSREVRIGGFRPGKAPYEILKQKIGEMTIMEAAAHIAINKTIDEAIKNHTNRQPVGQPEVNITKLAPSNPMEYKITLALLPEIKLSEYKNFKLNQPKIEISGQEVDRLIKDLRETRVKEIIVNREIKDGDKIILDIQLFLDKVPIASGQGKDVAVIVGKNYMVAGFDKKLLGAKKGDTRQFSLPYPKDYHMANLAGKIVEFKVAIKEVYERILPELNNKLAADFGLGNMDELKNSIKKSIISQKEQANKQSTEKEMLEKILTKTKFGDIPEILVNHEAKTMLAELEHIITSQGGKFDDYLSSIHKTPDQLTLDLLPEAINRVKTSLLVREIATVEKIKVGEEEVNKHIEEMKKYYQKFDKKMTEQIKTPEYRNYAVNMLISRKVIDKLRGWNIKE